MREYILRIIACCIVVGVVPLSIYADEECSGLFYQEDFPIEKYYPNANPSSRASKAFVLWRQRTAPWVPDYVFASHYPSSFRDDTAEFEHLMFLNRESFPYPTTSTKKQKFDDGEVGFLKGSVPLLLPLSTRSLDLLEGQLSDIVAKYKDDRTFFDVKYVIFTANDDPESVYILTMPTWALHSREIEIIENYEKNRDKFSTSHCGFLLIDYDKYGFALSTNYWSKAGLEKALKSVDPALRALIKEEIDCH